MKKLLSRLAAAVSLALVAAMGPLAQSAEAAVDVYITPGKHTLNGRQWSTTCGKYSSKVERCRTEIWATQVVLERGRYVQRTGWAFNNLTYKASARANWIVNPLGRTGSWTSNGREWYTECDTPTTGGNGCRSYIWGTAIRAEKTASGTRYVQVNGWQFNNMVRFTDDVYVTHSGTGSKEISLPAGMDIAYLTFTYKGTDRFDVGTLDESGQATYDGLTGTGDYTGSTMIGLLDEPPTTLYVDGEGSWTVTLKPWTAAPKLTGSAKGSSDEVFWYHGPAANKRFTYTGSGQIFVLEIAEEVRTLIDTTGSHTGTLRLQEGPLLIWIGTEGGPWAIG